MSSRDRERMVSARAPKATEPAVPAPSGDAEPSSQPESGPEGSGAVSQEPEALADAVTPAAPAAPASDPPPAPAADVQSDAPKATEPAAEPRYFMAEGKAVTSQRGVLATERGAKEPTEVFAKDFHHGQDTLDHLVSVGTVLKK